MALNPARPSWRLTDRLLAFYGCFVAVVALTRIDRPAMGLVLAAHLALPLLAWLAVRGATTPVGRVLHACYPVLLLPALYSAIDILNGFGSRGVFDVPIQSLELALFGGQPSRDWWRQHPDAFWSTVLHAAYFVYYVIVPVPLILFLVRRQAAVLTRYLDGVIATFLFCYVWYILVPVAGPYYEFARPTGEFVANAPARLVYATLGRGSAFGAAFPSSHVAATVAALIGTWRGAPRLAAILLIPTLLLTVGVVYCQMHYAVDSIAGVLVGAGMAGAFGRER
jgi:membrane-associated phospholipid phosphatase